MMMVVMAMVDVREANGRWVWCGGGRGFRLCLGEGQRRCGGLLGDHAFEDSCEGHGVAAGIPIGEEVTITVPAAVIQSNFVITVFTLSISNAT